jgi:CRP/FNR family nitrogen fixation transcriptional regulator
LDKLFGRTLHAARDAEIYAEGSPATHIFKVVSGAVRTCKIMRDGRRQVGEFALPGDFFGWNGIGAHFYSAEAVADSMLISYARRDVDHASAADREALRALHLMVLESLSAAQRRLLLLGRKTAVERVASFLLEMHERGSGKADEVRLPMTRSDIADHLGLTVETVSRALSSLKQSGAVLLEGAHQFRVWDWRKLEQLSGDDAAWTP